MPDPYVLDITINLSIISLLSLTVFSFTVFKCLQESNLNIFFPVSLFIVSIYFAFFALVLIITKTFPDFFKVALFDANESGITKNKVNNIIVFILTFLCLILLVSVYLYLFLLWKLNFLVEVKVILFISLILYLIYNSIFIRIKIDSLPNLQDLEWDILSGSLDLSEIKDKYEEIILGKTKIKWILEKVSFVKSKLSEFLEVEKKMKSNYEKLSNLLDNSGKFTNKETIKSLDKTFKSIYKSLNKLEKILSIAEKYSKRNAFLINLLQLEENELRRLSEYFSKDIEPILEKMREEAASVKDIRENLKRKIKDITEENRA